MPRQLSQIINPLKVMTSRRLPFAIFLFACFLLIVLFNTGPAFDGRPFESKIAAKYSIKPNAVTLAELARAAPFPVKPYKMVLCTLQKNEMKNLEEWVLYHYLLGVEHFILYDDQSEDNPRAGLAKWIEAGIVELIDYDNGGQHRDDYEPIVRRECLDGTAISKKDALWVSTIDIDEFLIQPRQPEADQFRPTPLHKLLSDWEARKNSVIILSRYDYSTNGHEKGPELPWTQGDYFTERKWHGHHGPTFAPKILGLSEGFEVTVPWCQHWVEPLKGYTRINPMGEEVHTLEDAGVWVYEPLRLVHFISRSAEYCLERTSNPNNNNAGRWRGLLPPAEICGPFTPGSPFYDLSLWTEDSSLRNSPTNEATRYIRATGGFFNGRRRT